MHLCFKHLLVLALVSQVARETFPPIRRPLSTTYYICYIYICIYIYSIQDTILIEAADFYKAFITIHKVIHSIHSRCLDGRIEVTVQVSGAFIH